MRSRVLGPRRKPLSTEDLEELIARGGDSPALEDTPPAPPRTGKRTALHRSHADGGWSMTLGVIDGTPVVLSGHRDGEIDSFTVGTALPVGPRLLAHESEVTALAFAELDGRPMVASGARDGTVRLWDLTDSTSLAAVRTSSEVRGLALHPSGDCVIGTTTGPLAVRFRLAGRGPTASPSRIPVDVRSARACPAHDRHVTETLAGEVEVTRMCIKGIQLGNPRTDLLEYAQGHCYVFADRLVLVRAGLPGWHAGDLVIPLGHAYCECEDVPHAYEYDGGHFRISIEGEGRYRALCCYRRSERDLLARLMAERRERAAAGPEPGVPTGPAGRRRSRRRQR